MPDAYRSYTAPPDRQWVGTREAAAMLGIDRAGVLRYIKAGRLNAEKVSLSAGIVGSYWRLKRSDVARFAATTRVGRR